MITTGDPSGKIILTMNRPCGSRTFVGGRSVPETLAINVAALRRFDACISASPMMLAATKTASRGFTRTYRAESIVRGAMDSRNSLLP